MKTPLFKSLAILLTLLFSVSPVWATCGGGGGGGGGGSMSGGSGVGGGGAAPVVYNVPWKIRKPADAPAQGLVLYWFPASKDELQKSSLRNSRLLSLYASQCVSMEWADGSTPNAEKLVGDSTPPVAVLAKPDGSPVSRIEKNKEGKLKVAEVEKLVESEVKQREKALDGQLLEAKAKATAGDNAAAIKLYQSVVVEKCMFPKKAKEAAKELKKLGAEVSAIPAAPVMDAAGSARIEQIMRRGLIAELNSRYLTADKLYNQAHRMDPADPTPLRYLGENYRHNIGDWDKARVSFEAILKMPADPLARAVALHGLGKMTIHDGEFKKGLALMEQSAAEFPLTLAYRNLAVYWNSERDFVKGDEYTKLALALDPTDPYNHVFAAVFMSSAGRGDEALKIASRNANLLSASYNLAGIYAQNGYRAKALALLRRHFFQYERYQAVRAKEMMEARVDVVFDSLREDREFLALTSGADGKLPMPARSSGMPAMNR